MNDKAKNHPVSSSQVTASQDIEIVAADRVIDIDAVKAHGGMPEIEIEPTFDPSKIDMEKFLAEELKVIIALPAQKHEAKYVYIGHQLTPEWARWKPRGVEISLKRYEVDILCNAKGTEVYQEKSADADGFESFVDKERMSLAYQFNVTYDPSGRRGALWLQNRLRSPK